MERGDLNQNHHGDDQRQLLASEGPGILDSSESSQPQGKSYLSSPMHALHVDGYYTI